MNRLHQLRETLPQNIEDNKGYPNLEFIVLDYNSGDGMEEWMHNNMADQIKAGRITYYRTPDPEVFSHSHSKNMAFKLATGDIVCNINADHFTGKNFADYVNEQFNIDQKIVITPIDLLKTKANYNPPTDVLGKVCVKKSDFYKVTGFDEEMSNYGFEDCDFINRLEMNGLGKVFIENPYFLQFIGHTNEERYSSEKLTNKVYAFYVHYIKPSKTEILFLYKNKTFELGTLIANSSISCDNPKSSFAGRNSLFEYSRQEAKWAEGIWNEDDIHLSLLNIQYKKGQINGCNTLSSEKDNKIYFKITDNQIIKDLSDFTHMYSSRVIMERNLSDKKIIVNQDFGKGLVYKNFNFEIPIYL
jgi:hypothetical protein